MMATVKSFEALNTMYNTTALAFRQYNTIYNRTTILPSIDNKIYNNHDERKPCALCPLRAAEWSECGENGMFASPALSSALCLWSMPVCTRGGAGLSSTHTHTYTQAEHRGHSGQDAS